MTSLRLPILGLALLLTAVASLAGMSHVDAQGATVTKPACHIQNEPGTRSHKVVTPSGQVVFICQIQGSEHVTGGGGPAVIEEGSCPILPGNQEQPTARVVTTPSGNRLGHCQVTPGSA